MPCKCEMRHEGAELRLVADCRGCKDGKGDLDDPACFLGILAAWGVGVVPDSIVLSGTVEAQYSGGAKEVFTRLAGLKAELERMSQRPTAGEKASKEEGKRCARCALAPSKVFNDLGQRMGPDMKGFYLLLRERAVKVSDASFNDHTCNKCLTATKDDMEFVWDRFEGVLRYVIKEGFQVVV